MAKNAFGKEIKDMADIVADPLCKDYITNTLGTIFGSLGVHDATLVETVLDYAQEQQPSYELKARAELEKAGITQLLPSALQGRSQTIYDQIKSYIVGQRVLDLGCGDGKVGDLLAENGLEVTLADIYQHEHVQKTGLSFRLLQANDRLDRLIEEEQYDTTLLLTVLHHSDNPSQTLDNAIQSTRRQGRIIVIESVYGIEDQTDFGRLTLEQQFAVNVFFDHFYNRIIHYNDVPGKKVNVPFNFNTPDQWRRIFESRSLQQVEMQCLGFDQPLVPEYHTLHILDKV